MENLFSCLGSRDLQKLPAIVRVQGYVDGFFRPLVIFLSNREQVLVRNYLERIHRCLVIKDEVLDLIHGHNEDRIAFVA